MSALVSSESNMRPAKRSAPRGVALTLIIAAVALLAAWLAFPYDKPVSDLFRAHEAEWGGRHAIQEFLQMMRPLGKGDVLLLLAMLLGLWGRRRHAVEIVLALIIVSALVWPAKVIVGRERPWTQNYQSFPSGDTASIAAFCVPLVYAHPALLPVAAGAVVVVAGGRVFDGRHYPSDVLAGMAFGLAAGALALWFAGRWGGRVRLRRGWCAWLMLGLLAIQGVLWMTSYRSPPGVYAFLRAWGPAIAIALCARFIPVLVRRRRGAAARLLGTRRGRCVAVVAASLVVWAVLAFTSTQSTLWDRDEPRFAKATLEMVESGNYLYPTFNGSLRPDKPVLIYWLMSVPVRIFGATELACRFWAPLGIVAAGLLTFWIGGRFFGAAAGLLAMAIMATTPLALMSGTAATTDAVLLACITAAVAAFAWSLRRGARPWHIALMLVALILALLVKGPVGLVLPFLVMAVVYRMARGERQISGRYLLWAGLAATVAVLVFLAWAIPANIATGGMFEQKGIGIHVFGRILAPMERHGGNYLLYLPYYLAIIAAAFFPWTLYLPAALAALVRRQCSTLAGRALVIGWAAPVVVFMSLVATKLPHYILPAWPALALAVAVYAPRLDELKPPSAVVGWVRTGAGLFLVVGFGLAAGLILAPWFLPVPGLRIPMFSLGLAMFATTWCGWRLFSRNRHRTTVVFLAAAMMVFNLALAAGLLPPLESYKVSAPIAHAINRVIPRDVPVAVFKYNEPSLYFYLDRTPIVSLGSHQEVWQWANAPGRGVLVIPRADINAVRLQFGSLPLVLLAADAGYNYSNGRAVDLLVLERGGR